MISSDFPKVTVMIPTFNQEQFIARSVQSALLQDYPNLEIVISDDCSLDNTYNVIRPFLADDRLKYFKNATNLGRVANYRKTLYERATGVWALNLDGDDNFYTSDAISSLIAELLSHKDDSVVAVMGSYLVVDSELENARQPFPNYNPGVFAGLDLFLNWDQLSFGHLATLYRTDLAKAIDYYRANIISSDWESILRLILHGKVIVTKKIIGVWNIHGENATMTKSMAEGIRDFRYIEDTYKYGVELGINRRVLGRWLRKMIRFHTNVLWSSNARNCDKIRILLPYIVSTYPFAITSLASPRAVLKMALSVYPPLFFMIRDLYRGNGAR